METASLSWRMRTTLRAEKMQKKRTKATFDIYNMKYSCTEADLAAVSPALTPEFQV